MKSDNKKIIIPVALISLIAIGLVFGSSMFSPTSIPSTVSAQYNTFVCVGTTGATADNPTHGTYKDLGCKHNMLTNAGIGALGNVLNGSTKNINITWIALANATNANAVILPTDTALNGEWVPSPASATACGLGNATATSVGQAQGAWNLTHTWTSTCAYAIINTTALYNSSIATAGSTGTPTYPGLTPLLFAEANFTTTTLQSADQINVTWGIFITGTQ